MLPDRSVLIGQKLVENAEIQNFKCDILCNFQTMWHYSHTLGMHNKSGGSLGTLFRGHSPLYIPATPFSMYRNSHGSGRHRNAYSSADVPQREEDLTPLIY